MHIVSIGLDPKTLDPESVVAFRNRAYGGIVDHYSVIVPTPATVTVQLSDRTTAYGVSGVNKAVQLWNIHKLTASLIRTGKCDVITTQDPYFLGLLGYFFAKRYHLGFEIQILGLEKLTPLRRLLARFVLKRASVVRALSDRLQDRLIREFGVPEEKINVVTIYVDVQKLGLDMRTLDDEALRTYEERVRNFKEKYDRCFNFLTVSRLVSIKNISMQLAAVERLAKEFPEEERLKREVKERGIEAFAIFHGPKYGYELGMFYIECDCFLLTSDYEGWGMVITEAATAGIPVIMTDVGCAGDIIVDGVSGLVIPIRNTEVLITAMRRMITEPEQRNTLSIGATRALESLPSFEVILEQYRKNWQIALQHPL
jgi:glycosyltransferase involved in cell wall biosynthesis